MAEEAGFRLLFTHSLLPLTRLPLKSFINLDNAAKFLVRLRQRLENEQTPSPDGILVDIQSARKTTDRARGAIRKHVFQDLVKLIQLLKLRDGTSSSPIEGL